MWDNINKQLNEMNTWKDRTCDICGRKYPETVLNIESHLHHNATGLICVDTKACKLAAKKKKK